MIAHAIKEEGSTLYGSSPDVEFKTLKDVLPENISGIRKIIKDNLSIDKMYDSRDDNLNNEEFLKSINNNLIVL